MSSTGTRLRILRNSVSYIARSSLASGASGGPGVSEASSYIAMRSNLSRLQNKTHSSRGATVSESSIVCPETLTRYGQRFCAENSWKRVCSLFAKEYRRFDAYHGVTPDVFMIKRLASAYVNHEHLEFVPVHIVVQLARFRHVLYMELGGGHERRTGPANAECSLRRRGGPARKMVDDGSDGCT